MVYFSFRRESKIRRKMALETLKEKNEIIIDKEKLKEIILGIKKIADKNIFEKNEEVENATTKTIAKNTTVGE